ALLRLCAFRKASNAASTSFRVVRVVMAWVLSLCVRSIGRFLSVTTISGRVKVVKPYVRVASPSLSVIMIMGHLLECALACHTCGLCRLPTPIDRRSGCTLSRDIDNRKRIVRLDSPRCILGCLNNGIILSPEYPASLVIANATEVSTNRKQVIPRYFSVRCGIGKKRGDSIASVSSRGCLQRGCQAFPVICTDDERSVFFGANKYLVHGVVPSHVCVVDCQLAASPAYLLG